MRQSLRERIYLTFNYPGSVPGDQTLIGGIRKDDGIYYISGSYIPTSGQTIPFVYKGDIRGTTGPCSNNTWNTLRYPSEPGRTVTATALYGPDVKQHGNIRVVGNYATEETGGNTLGAMYEGKLNGSGVWTTLLPSPEALNTIAHSTMENLVVGNYDTVLIQGKAFIYDVNNKTYHEIVKYGAKSITAYGIWYNGKNHYTICGGFSNGIISNESKDKNLEHIDRSKIIDSGYVVDWDNKKKIFYNWREYHYNNDDRSVITHFDGISSYGCDGYTLTGDALVEAGPNSEGVAFIAHIERKHNGEFSRAIWERIKFPGSSTTSGNSVAGNTVIGIYVDPSQPQGTVNSFISIVI